VAAAQPIVENIQSIDERPSEVYTGGDQRCEDKQMNPYSVCVIGNSYAAAPYYAWKNRRPAVAPGVSLTFFAAQVEYLQHLTLAGTRLQPDDPELARRLCYTSGGKYAIEIGAYDAFILVGLRVRPDVGLLCESYGWTDHLKWGGVASLVSKTCFEAILAGSFTRSLAFHFLGLIRSVSAAPVLISPCPFPTDAPRPTDVFRNEARRAAIMQQAMETGSALAKDRGGEIVWQPEMTIASPGITKPKFAENGLQLQDQEPSKDGTHMNEKFGYLTLAALLARLDEISGGYVLAKYEQQAEQRTKFGKRISAS